ncbi:MAG: deoxyribose-phosphate aldolase [Clostridiaceae bacterium]|nr:deoxyribose-phosphate aldolase [Clostridiaceae bacterium]
MNSINTSNHYTNLDEILQKPLSKYIDHTLLKADATEEQIKILCQEALKYDFASVCVNSCYVNLVADMLKGSDVKTCCVVGFPLGAMNSKAKAFETKTAVDLGAEEIDMVINIGALKSGNLGLVKDDIASVVAAAGKDALVKVIIETCLLNNDEKIVACNLSMEAGAHFVKTSTGFSTDGAVEHDVVLMRKTVGSKMGVKASGGIRDLDTALSMIKAGADRIGTSSGIKIIQQFQQLKG